MGGGFHTAAGHLCAVTGAPQRQEVLAGAISPHSMFCFLPVPLSHNLTLWLSIPPLSTSASPSISLYCTFHTSTSLPHSPSQPNVPCSLMGCGVARGTDLPLLRNDLVVCECELYAYCTFVCVCVRECVFVCRRECACMSLCVCVSENMWQHGNNYLKYKVSLLAPGSTVLELAPVSLCT